MIPEKYTTFLPQRRKNPEVFAPPRQNPPVFRSLAGNFTDHYGAGGRLAYRPMHRSLVLPGSSGVFSCPLPPQRIT